MVVVYIPNRTTPRASTGVTLVELLVALAIVAIVLLFAMPHYAAFMDNTRVRNVTESLANGVRQAQLEAVKRNERVKFVLAASGWEVRDVETNGLLLSEAVFEKAASNAPVIEVGPGGASEITFSGLGRALVRNPPDDTEPIGRIKVKPGAAGTRPLGVVVAVPGGNVRVCDPDSRFTHSGSTDPVGCPHPW